LDLGFTWDLGFGISLGFGIWDLGFRGARRATRFALRAAVSCVLCASACSSPPEQLTLKGRTITVFNDTRESWKGVEIWVNDHYRVTRDTIAPGERFGAPLEMFVAGFGQRFQAGQQVTGIEVTGTDESGDPIKLVWGNGRRR
jgi:hypothetical protein